MKYLDNLHPTLFFVFVLIFFSKDILASNFTYEIEIGGVYQDLVKTNTLSICPNTNYNIRIKTATAGQIGHFVSSNPGAIEFSNNGGVTFSTGPLCTDGATQEIMVVRFLSAGSQGIVIYDYTGGPIGDCASLGTGTLGTGSTFNFTVQEPVSPVLDTDIDACVNSGDLIITGGCLATGALCTGNTVTYEWFQGASSLAGPSTAASSGNEFTVTAGTISGLTAGTGNFTLTMVIYKDHTGIVCADQADITVHRRELPALSSLTFDKSMAAGNASNAYTSNSTSPATEAEICLNEDQDVSVTCTGACPPNASVNGSNYEWFIRPSTETLLTGPNVQSSGATNGTTGSTNASGTGEFTINPSTLSINPGIHDVLVVATNEWGCTAQLELADEFIVNDLPGVELQHDGSLGGALTSLDGVTVCRGREIALSPYVCDANNYTTNPATVYTKNLTNNSDPNNPSLASAGAYNSPCGGTNNDYFAYLEWRAFNGATQLDFTGGSNPFTAVAPTGGSTILFSNNPSSANTAVIRTEITGTITYELTAIGHNGCSNTDEIDVVVQDPEITYRTPDGTIHNQNGVISACENTTIDVEALCDLCESSFNVSWGNNGGPNPLNPTPTSNATSNPVTSSTIVVSGGTDTRYYANISDSKGCVNQNNTNSFRLRGVEAPSVTSITYANPLCSGDDFRIELSGPAATPMAGYRYDLYDGDPSAGGVLVYSCSGNCDIQNVNTTANTVDLVTSAISGQTAYQPVDGKTYYLVAKQSGDCETTVMGATAVVNESPNTLVGTGSVFDRNPNNEYCNNQTGRLFLDLNGGSTSWNFAWSRTNQTPAPSGPPTNIPAVDIAGFTDGGQSSGSFWGFLNPPIGASIINNPPISGNYTVDFEVVVTNGGCSQTVPFTGIEIINCEAPVLQAELLDEFGAPVSGFSLSDIGTPAYNYVCEGGSLRLRAEKGSSSYSAIYSWNTGENTAEIIVPTSPSSPDTFYRSVYVMRDLGGGVLDTTGFLEHTFVVSRGNVNFYPQGDNSSTIDTSICETEQLFAQANCPTCLGDLSYIWDVSTTNDTVHATNGSTYQLYATGPPVGMPLANFDVNLTLKHGELGSCEETVVRQISVNDLPVVSLVYTSSAYNGGSLPSPAYLCDGDVATLTANCLGCNPTLSTYTWNTGATTPSINIASQGGYYAQITNEDGCRQITQVAVVVDALDGLNSPVVANPSEICDGNPVALEIAPCVGCSYQWIDQTTAATIPSGRIHSTVDTGVYYAVVTNAQNCTYQTAQLLINETTPAVPSIWGTTDSVCANQTARLWTNSGTGFRYQWYKDDGSGFYLISGATDSSYTTIPGEIGTFKVAVIYPNGCIEESNLFIINSATFTPNIYNNGINEICKGATVELSTDLYANWQYQWYRDGILIQDTSATGSIYYADSAGSYYVEVTNYNLCVVQSSTINLIKTTLSKPTATTTTPTICPGELGKLSVSLCTGCRYEWFNTTPTSLAPSSVLGFNYNSVTASGDYYAVVSKGICSETSDTVNITVNPVFTPAITSSSNVVCDGRNALLVTPGCTGCSYSWLKDGAPVLGALNDTFHNITSIIDTGDYQIAVDYPNGCSDTSITLTVSNGSYNIDLVIDTSNNRPLDSVICNGVGEVLTASTSITRTGTYFYTLYLDNTPVTNYSNVTFSSFPGDSAGIYTVQAIDPLGCRALSNLLPLRKVDVVPILTSRATADPNSVTASAICTDSGTVHLDVSNCTGCDFLWVRSSNLVSDTITSIDTLLIENFETGTLATGWTRLPTTVSLTTGGWVIDSSHYLSSTGFPIPSTGRSIIAASNDDTCSCNMIEDRIITDGIDLSITSVSLLEEARLAYDGYYIGTSVATVDVSTTSATGPWTTISTVNSNPEWQTRYVDLTNYIDSGTIWLSFHHSDTGVNVIGPNAKGFAIDNVLITRHKRTTYITSEGTAGTGGYTVTATNDGCSAISNLVTIADLTIIANPLNSEANTTDTSICNGQSVTLEHAASMGNPSTHCSGCSFRWLRTLNPINGASNYQYVTSTPGTYNLEVTTSDGCVDTSSVISIRQVDPPSGLTLDFDSLVYVSPTVQATGTPLASNGDSIDMNNWIFPAYARHDLANTNFSSYFRSAPFNGALAANAGLQGTDSINFHPADSLSGYHLITYYYDTLGCVFTVSDVLEVLPPAAISVTNLNPSSVAYEACVGDDLVINAVNLDFAIDQVFAFDADDNYQLIGANSITSTSDTFGTNVRWNTNINLTVPGNAYASYLMLIGDNLVTGRRDTLFTSYVLIHNTDLSFTGLPNMLCSNGEGITLFGSPTGGSFSARDISTGALIPGAFVGDTLYPQQFNQSAYVDGNQYVDIYYSYTETYTNGNLCPDNDTVSKRKEVKDVRLTDVQFNTISVSQTRELLTNLVYQTTPYAARPNKQPLYVSTFSGSFTNPAGRPTEFLPANAGVGTHALTYSIKSGDCINSVEDSITVVAAPTPIPMPDTICRNYGTTPFAREIARFPYSPPSVSYPPNTAVASYTDELNIINVTGAGVTAVSTVPGNESYTYDPTLVSGNYDTLIIEYGFYRDEDTLDVYGSGNPVDFDTLEYVVARIVKPIYIEDLTPVNIIDTIVSPFYCQENILHLLAGNPSNNSFGGGIFMLYGGTNQYQFGDTLFNSVINPYDVNHLENAITTYDLVYILDGVVCNNSDTMSITINRGLNPTFATANGLDEFCDTDPNVQIIHNVSSPDTAIWTIGGVPQPSYVFGPDPLDPGLHVVELQQLSTYIQGNDTFVCSASAIDTFTIHALPALTMLPPLETQYCANDTVVDLTVSPTPSCNVYGASGHIVLDEKFNSGIPPSWNSTYSFGGKNWTGATSLPQGGTGGAAFIDTSHVLTDSWLITKSLNLVAGHRYRLTYMVRAGELDSTCSGFCDAALVVAMGPAANPANMGAQLDLQLAISEDRTYVRYVVDHYHDPLLGFTTGTYHLGFRSATPAYGRSLRLDNVRMRDMTIADCSLTGIGYMDGPGVHHVTDSSYQFNPLAVPTGNVEVKYVYTDVRGCQDSLVYPITVDTAPIVSFTDLPPTYCENEPTLLLTGTPLGGQFTSTMGTNLVPVGLAVLDTANFPVNYQTNTTGNDIVTYRFEDNNGCVEIVHDTIDIVPLLDSVYIANSLDPFGNGHCVDADSTILDVNLFSGTLITNGTFYGAGVRNGTAGAGGAIFYPDSAEIDMGHTGDVTVEYIYNTTTGCADTTRFTTRVHALPDLTFMNLPDSLCLNADSFQVVAINHVVTGAMGQIMYADTLINEGTYIARDTSGNNLPNFIQLFDTLYPYTADGYSQVNVTYSYTAPSSLGLCSSTIYDSVRIDTVPIVYFEDLRPYYCENEPQSIFLAFPAFSVGSGYLSIDSTRIDSSFFWIDPSTMVGPGQTTAVYPVYYTFTDTRGCRGEGYDTFEVRPYPRIVFDPMAQDTFCRQVGRYDLRQLVVAPTGGYFTDNLALTSIQDSFFLNLNALAGPRLVTYHYVDPATQCENQDSIWLYLFNAPEIDFTVYGGCAQMDITFDPVTNNLVNGIDSITSIWWDFEGNGMITNSPLDTSAITMPDMLYQYTASGTYNVTLNVQNQGSCPASLTKPLIISPYHDLASDYFEDFNSGAGDWYDDQPIDVTPSNVWTHENSLTGNHISNSNGFWVTMAAGPLYEVNQSAWVYSPCFDFTNSRRPMIALDLWRDASPRIDGAVLEFYNNTSNQWELVGDVGEGINWYQYDFVLSQPGNQLNMINPKGWSGRSNGPESARLRLDQFKGQRDVRFRIAFASALQSVIDSLSGNDYEGVAFDNVWIGERTRNVLVEHFDHVNYVNSNSIPSSVINQSVYNKIFNSWNGLDVILIQYQTEDLSLTADPLYLDNEPDLSSRQYQYSAQPNNIFIDGQTVGDGLSESLSQWHLDHDMLQFPDFDIQITTPVSIVNGVLTAEATVEALTAKDSSIIYTTRVAVIQDSFTYVGNSHILSAFRKMLPNNAGIRKTNGWQQGEQQLINEPLTLSTLGQRVPVDETQLEVIVFVQNANDNSREVYQASTTQDLNRYTGTIKVEDDEATEIFSLNVYPNPSSNLFNVSFDKALEGEYNWRLVDVTGRVLQTGQTAKGTEQFTINAERLVDGAYFFIINSDDNRAYAQRKLIVIK
ncbi:T9SS type A sorting domain-containing protein [Aureispira sp. CCB-QB1]|uniref:T9SS type A sorting domain-containing protein n=1 Tax=Aureispira sp. CCB-QB1 TaxID=1313421 RepID=UPI000698459A|nr:T9SS type A sorting domain-containing protein [Aureispira sp. CCB-QB1]